MTVFSRLRAALAFTFMLLAAASGMLQFHATGSLPAAAALAAAD